MAGHGQPQVRAKNRLSGQERNSARPWVRLPIIIHDAQSVLGPGIALFGGSAQGPSGFSRAGAEAAAMAQTKARTRQKERIFCAMAISWNVVACRSPAPVKRDEGRASSERMVFYHRRSFL